MGTRSLERGGKALEELVAANPSAKDNIELLQVDTSDKASVEASAAAVKAKLDAKGQQLYGVVNNAGTGLGHNVTVDAMFKTNVWGPKWMTDAFLPLLDPNSGRIVNVGSGGGPMVFKNLSEPDQ